MRIEPKRLLFARRRKWYDLGGELHPLMALAIIALVLAGVPSLAWTIQPWVVAQFE
jgi:hypothetical protein